MVVTILLILISVVEIAVAYFLYKFFRICDSYCEKKLQSLEFVKIVTRDHHVLFTWVHYRWYIDFTNNRTFSPRKSIRTKTGVIELNSSDVVSLSPVTDIKEILRESSF